MKVSDHLTFSAEVILQQVHSLANQALLNQGIEPPALAIVAYGKLGGIELSYDSDLDLVFLYEKGNISERDIVRLVQKIIHLINTRTATGILYSVDTRLRPSGQAGLLVISFDAFAEYQKNNAWTWEHQALVRARVVSGDLTLQEKFEQYRQDILKQKRSLEILRKDVREMRHKMQLNSKKQQTEYDFKYAKGGMTDIEFIVQYGVLAWANQHPALLQWTDNIRILLSLVDAGLLSESDGELLCKAYQVYRDVGHQQLLHGQAQESVIAAALSYLKEVKRIWAQLLGVDC
jgi:glutamate-ammonia-ligase adenylyltransferase